MKYIQLGEQSKQPSDTSHYVEVDNCHFVSDFGAASLEKDGKKQYVLPEYDLISGIHVSFAWLSHLHRDHSLSGPRFHQLHPEAELYCSFPTYIGLLEMFRQDLRQWERNPEERLFTEDEAAAFLEKLKEGIIYEPMWARDHPGLPGWELGFYPNDHTPGSMMVLVKTPERNLLFTGDCASHKQFFSKGVMMPPAEFLGDFLEDAEAKGGLVLVTEGTNGARVIPNADDELSNLVDFCEEVRFRQGSVVITAFSEMRAPGVALKMSDKYPVHLDGGGRDWWLNYKSGEYTWSPTDMFNAERMEELERTHRVILMEGTRRERNDHARAISEGRDPCTNGAFSPIIAPSANGDNGPSADYLQMFLPEEKNGVASTGHRFPHSVMEKIGNASKGKRVKIGGVDVPVYADVKGFDFSAHDGGDKLALRAELSRARHVIMHHGDDRNLRGLETRLSNLPNPPRVYWGRCGELVEI